MDAEIVRPSTDDYFLKMLGLVASRGTCIRRRVACIIVSGEKHVLATGYNGPPQGFPHCITKPCEGAVDEPGKTENCLAVHAEINALLQCSRLDLAYTMYTSTSPCFSCAKAICNTNIRRIVCLQAYADARGIDLLTASGRQVIIL